MPTENSFTDRIGRFTLLKDACDGMSPAFTPADSDITVLSQTSLITVLNTCCTVVTTAATDLKDQTDARVALVKTLKERVTRALNRVASNRAWAAKLPAVKAAADKVRGMKLPRTGALPVPSDPDAPVPKVRERGGESYRDIEGHVGKFIAALGKCAAYDTGAPADITSLMLMTLQGSLKTLNDQIAEKEVTLRDVQIERLRVFESKKPLPDGSASLRDRWARIKKAVKAQYGTGSAEYALVAPIKY